MKTEKRSLLRYVTLAILCIMVLYYIVDRVRTRNERQERICLAKELLSESPRLAALVVLKWNFGHNKGNFDDTISATDVIEEFCPWAEDELTEIERELFNCSPEVREVSIAEIVKMFGAEDAKRMRGNVNSALTKCPPHVREFIDYLHSWDAVFDLAELEAR